MQPDRRIWGIVAGFSGFAAIVMGAVGAHAVADPHGTALVETASIYELVHAVVILWLRGAHGKYAALARWALLIGTVLFCGTIYLKAVAGWDAAVRLAPLGGVSFMLGWLLIALDHCVNKGSAET
jgi:uncharacterized membrane protein YgdD (TMEM256/DUF423 family)